MSVRLVVAVTDDDWYYHLRQQNAVPEVNFWSPSNSTFRALQAGELFLFKLHSPNNFIVGGGIFAHANSMPCSLAWEAFGHANGANSLAEMRTRIAKYRRIKPDPRDDFVVGCSILTQPFFFEKANWITVPNSFALNTVTFKGYSTAEEDGRRLWDAVQVGLQADTLIHSVPISEQSQDLSERPQARYGEPVLVRPRLGQGAFRVLVTDNYQRRCAVSGERTLPALDAAHIRPYSEGGHHEVSNGILLRRDIHSLFDLGYVTISPDMRFVVSHKIREEFENGRHYYALHGSNLSTSSDIAMPPDKAALSWHNENRFKG